MFLRRIAFAVSFGLLVQACVDGPVEPPTETEEIIANLIEAGFPTDDIQILDGLVHVGGDAQVSLAASREMRQSAGPGPEQYRSTNIVRTSTFTGGLLRICIQAPASLTGAMSTALDMAIQNYNEQTLAFVLVRTPPAVGCNHVITVQIAPGLVGGSSGFPSGGAPFRTLTIGGGLATRGVDTIEHVFTHEIGHTLGLRHSDYFNRSISCGGSPVNEESPPSGDGVIHIPGTPTGATVGGSIMNACFRTTETGEFTDSDRAALERLYGQQVARHDIREEDYQDVFDDITAGGFRPVWVDGYEVAGETRFNAVFVPSTVAWTARHNLTAESYQTEFDLWAGQRGLRLSQVDSYLLGGEVRYAAIFDSAPGASGIAYHNVDQATHDANFNAFVAQGLRPVNISVVVSSGARTFTAIYDRAAVGSFAARVGMTEVEYQAEFNSNVAAGRRLSYVNAFMEDGVPRLSAIWDQSSASTWSASHGQISAQYQIEYEARTGQALLVRQVAGYEWGGNSRFASLFTAF